MLCLLKMVALFCVIYLMVKVYRVLIMPVKHTHTNDLKLKKEPQMPVDYFGQLILARTGTIPSM